MPVHYLNPIFYTALLSLRASLGKAVREVRAGGRGLPISSPCQIPLFKNGWKTRWAGVSQHSLHPSGVLQRHQWTRSPRYMHYSWMHWRCLSCSSLSFVGCILCSVFFLVTSEKNKLIIFVFDAVDSDNLNYLNYRLEGNWPQTRPASTLILLYLLSPDTALLTPLRPLLPLLPCLDSQSPPAHLNPDSTPLMTCAVPLLPEHTSPGKLSCSSIILPNICYLFITTQRPPGREFQICQQLSLTSGFEPSISPVAKVSTFTAQKLLSGPKSEATAITLLNAY